VIGLEGKYNDEINSLYRVVQDFFKQETNIKKINEDPKKEGMGYVETKTKQYLKLRKYGDRTQKFPETPSDLKEKYVEGLNIFHSITWNILRELCRFTHKYTNPEAIQFSDKDWNIIEDAVKEMGSIGVTHYSPRPKEEVDSSNMVDICSAHRDTGILTFVVVSEVPGLQVWDRSKDTWMDVERLLWPQRAKQHLLVAMMGEKIEMFTGSKVLKATDHRVMVPPETGRDSLLYFMDVSP